MGSPRSIQWFRKWGFDVFDDVVDHSYDLIGDPSERILRAIDDNIHLLDGSVDLDKLMGRSRRTIQSKLCSCR